MIGVAMTPARTFGESQELLADSPEASLNLRVRTILAELR